MPDVRLTVLNASCLLAARCTCAFSAALCIMLYAALSGLFPLMAAIDVSSTQCPEDIVVTKTTSFFAIACGRQAKAHLVFVLIRNAHSVECTLQHIIAPVLKRVADVDWQTHKAQCHVLLLLASEASLAQNRHLRISAGTTACASKRVKYVQNPVRV